MGQPVVLQQAPSPVSQLVGGVASFLAAKRKAQLEQQAVNYQHSRDKVADSHWSQSFGLEQNRDTREATAAQHQNELFPGQLKAQNLTNDNLGITNHLDQLSLQTEQALKPYKIRRAQLDEEFRRGEITTQQKQLESAKLDLQIKTVEAQSAAKAKQLQLALAQAQIAHENAATGEIGVEGNEASARAAYTRAQTAKLTDPNADNPMAKISPYAQTVLGSLQAHGKQYSPMQMLIRVNSDRRMSPQDKGYLAQILNGATTADYNPAATGYSKSSAGAVPVSIKERQTEYSKITSSPFYKALPADVQSYVYDNFVTGGHSLADIEKGLTANGHLSDTELQAVTKALSGS